MQHEKFQKRSQKNLLSVSVRVKHLLICYCKLLKFDMQHDHILIKLILFSYGGGGGGPRGRIRKQILIWSSGGPSVQRSGTICAILFKSIIRNNSVKLF